MPRDRFALTISLPSYLLPWIDRKKAEGYVLSRIVAALVLAEWKRETGRTAKELTQGEKDDDE